MLHGLPPRNPRRNWFCGLRKEDEILENLVRPDTLTVGSKVKHQLHGEKDDGEHGAGLEQGVKFQEVLEKR